jgi:TPR repeat protein
MASGESLRMRMSNAICVIGALYFLGTTCATAQIRYLTVRTPKSPLPAGSVISPSNTTPAGQVAPTAPPVLGVPPRVAPAPIKPSLDKAERDRRVVEFQKKRAGEGLPSAQYELGVRYMNGEGVDKDLKAARKWLSKSAEAGNSEAQKKLKELPPEGD